MYAIIGVTGQVGSRVANLLMEKKLAVRAVIRNPEKAAEWLNKGAEVAIAELHDADALAEAFKDTLGVFVMTPPLFQSADPMDEHHQMLAALCLAIKKAKPAKVVYLSSIGAQHSQGTGAIKKLFDMEQVFQQLNVPTSGIRAAWFMENFAGSIPYAKQSGILASFLNPTDEHIPMVAAADIGKLAAELLEDNWTGHQTIELEGPCRYSADEVAMMLSWRFNQHISAQPIDETNYEATYRSFGFTPLASYLMAEMNKGFNNKYIVFEGKNTIPAKGETLLEDAINSFTDE